MRLTPNAALGVVLGAGYLLVGAVCSAVALGSDMASAGHGAGPGAAHCAAYLTVGALVLAGVGLDRARSTNTAVGAGFLILGVTLLARDAGAQLLALHHPDAVVHLVSAALLVGFGRTQE